MAGYNPQLDLERILEAAAGADPGTRYLLNTIIARYQTQLRVLQDLQSDIKERGSLVLPPGSRAKSKRVPNPSIAEYGKASAAANATARTLLSVLGRLDPGETGEEDPDEL